MLDFDDPAFSFRTDRLRKLVDISVIGHWDVATMNRFEHQLQEFHKELEQRVCRVGEQITIFDLRGFAVQSPVILLRIASKVKDPTIASRHVSVLISSMLLRMQVRRIAPRYGIFATREEAVEWLVKQCSAAHEP